MSVYALFVYQHWNPLMWDMMPGVRDVPKVCLLGTRLLELPDNQRLLEGSPSLPLVSELYLVLELGFTGCGGKGSRWA